MRGTKKARLETDDSPPSLCLDRSSFPRHVPSVFAFLSLFISQYSKYAKNDFHISGESYAGTYLPNIATVIQANTLALTELGSLAPLPTLNFKSVLIGNGLTDPKVQFGTGSSFSSSSLSSSSKGNEKLTVSFPPHAPFYFRTQVSTSTLARDLTLFSRRMDLNVLRSLARLLLARSESSRRVSSRPLPLFLLLLPRASI